MSGAEKKPGEEPGGGKARSEETDGGLVFRYDQERRLAKAPESVRWLASRRGQKRASLLGGIFATRASRLLFFTIIALVLAFNFANLLSGRHGSGKLGGDHYAAAAFWYEGRVLVSLSRSGSVLPEGGRRVLEVTVAIGRGNAAVARFEIGAAASENFRLALDTAGEKPDRVALHLADGPGRLELVAPVD